MFIELEIINMTHLSPKEIKFLDEFCEHPYIYITEGDNSKPLEIELTDFTRDHLVNFLDNNQYLTVALDEDSPDIEFFKNVSGYNVEIKKGYWSGEVKLEISR